MHSVISKTGVISNTGVISKTGVISNKRGSSKEGRVLTASEMGAPCMLAGRVEVNGITRTASLLGMLLLLEKTELAGGDKTLTTRMRWLVVRVCGRGCSSGIAICRYSKRNLNGCGRAGSRFP